MKAVFTYWSKGESLSGFASEADLVTSMAFALSLAKMDFAEIELVTDTAGKALLIDKYKLPFNTVLTGLDQYSDLDSSFWALAKIYACSVQTEPFIHIDNDLFLTHSLPLGLLTESAIFETSNNFAGFGDLQDKLPSFETIEGLKVVSCAIMGFMSQELIDDVIPIWFARASDFISAINTDDLSDDDKHFINQIYEQYFISAILSDSGIDYNTLQALSVYEHGAKDPAIIDIARQRLFAQWPEYIDQLTP